MINDHVSLRDYISAFECFDCSHSMNEIASLLIFHWLVHGIRMVTLKLEIHVSMSIKPIQVSMSVVLVCVHKHEYMISDWNHIQILFAWIIHPGLVYMMQRGLPYHCLDWWALCLFVIVQHILGKDGRKVLGWLLSHIVGLLSDQIGSCWEPS